MKRYKGAKFKLSRREGVNLTGTTSLDCKMSWEYRRERSGGRGDSQITG